MGFLSKIINKNKSMEKNSTISINATFSPPPSQTDIPEYKGDYAKAVFLNAYKEASPIKKAEEYQQYLKYEFGITDASAFHRKMINEGYLGKASIEDRLLASKTPDLKTILQKIGQPKTGKKEELVQRVIANTDEKTIISFLPIAEEYSITEKGKEFLLAYADVIDLYLNRTRYGVSYDEYMQAKARYNKANYHDVLWGIYQSRAMDCARKGQIDVADELYMYYLLYDEKRYVDALDHMISYFYYYINEIQGTNNYIALYRISKQKPKAFLSNQPVPRIVIPPFCVEVVKKMKEYYSQDMIDRTSTGFIEYCSREEFSEILNDIMADRFDIKECEQKLNARVPSVLEKVLNKL